jgi:hypothetical protein
MYYTTINCTRPFGIPARKVGDRIIRADGEFVVREVLSDHVAQLASGMGMIASYLVTRVR